MAKKYHKLIFDYMDNTFFEKFNPNSYLTLFKYLENRKEEEKRNFNNKVSKVDFKQLISDKAQAKSSYDNKIAFFTTIDESKYLIFAELDYSLVVYNLILPDVIIKIPKAHENHINSVQHKIHPVTKNHYILTSSYDLSIKVWHFNCKKGKLKNILKIPMAGLDHGLLGTLMFNQTSKCNYVITCSLYKNIRIWDFNDGKALKKAETKNYLFFIDSFHEKNQDKYYVIVGSDSNVQSWN